MFCPYCASESTPGLNYCKRCGGNLAPLAQGPAQETRPVVVVSPGAMWAAALSMTAVIVIGLGMIFPMTGELTLRGMPPTAVVAIALFVSLAVLGCAAMLLRFWSLVLGVGGAGRASKATPALPDPKSTDTRELGTARFDALNPASIPSITEQTTRTLEHVNKKY
jgi:hypothetical protein